VRIAEVGEHPAFELEEVEATGDLQGLLIDLEGVRVVIELLVDNRLIVEGSRRQILPTLLAEALDGLLQCIEGQVVTTELGVASTDPGERLTFAEGVVFEPTVGEGGLSLFEGLAVGGATKSLFRLS
jgi:hypothetical protein